MYADAWLLVGYTQKKGGKKRWELQVRSKEECTIAGRGLYLMRRCLRKEESCVIYSHWHIPIDSLKTTASRPCTPLFADLILPQSSAHEEGRLSRSKVCKVPVVPLSLLLRVGRPVAIVLRVRVEALGVAGVPDGRQDGPLAAAVQDVVPVGAPEEGVLLDAAGAAADVAEPPGAVDCAKGPDDVLGFLGYWRVSREHDGLFYYSGRRTC
jgi:hypothetical protein